MRRGGPRLGGGAQRRDIVETVSRTTSGADGGPGVTVVARREQVKFRIGRGFITTAHKTHAANNRSIAKSGLVRVPLWHTSTSGTVHRHA